MGLEQSVKIIYQTKICSNLLININSWRNSLMVYRHDVVIIDFLNIGIKLNDSDLLSNKLMMVAG